MTGDKIRETGRQQTTQLCFHKDKHIVSDKQLCFYKYTYIMGGKCKRPNGQSIVSVKSLYARQWGLDLDPMLTETTLKYSLLTSR